MRKSLTLLTILVLTTANVHAVTTHIWDGITSDDLNDPSNWEGGIPGSGQTGVFDSTVPNISLTPTETANFDVGALYFPHDAHAFTFFTDNYSLTLDSTGPSIYGSATNTTINATNSNNPYHNSFQVNFLNSTSIGSAEINVVNIAINIGDTETRLSGIEYEQLGVAYSASTLLDTGSTIRVTNSGINDSSANTNQITGIRNSQTYFNNPLQINDNASITVSNSGLNMGTGGGNSVGTVRQWQLTFNDPVTTGEHFTLTISNNGTDYSTGYGTNKIGYIRYPQLYHAAPIYIGPYSSIALSNEGTNTSDGSGNYTGFVRGNQLNSENNFYAYNNFSLTAINVGTDKSSSGSNNSIGQILNYPQASFYDRCTVTDHVNFTISNQGGSFSNGSENATGVVNGPQLYVSGDMSANDYFTLSTTNSGYDHSAYGTHNTIGHVGDALYTDVSQVTLTQACNLGDSATIKVSNSGTNYYKQLLLQRIWPGQRNRRHFCIATRF